MQGCARTGAARRASAGCLGACRLPTSACRRPDTPCWLTAQHPREENPASLARPDHQPGRNSRRAGNWARPGSHTATTIVFTQSARVTGPCTPRAQCARLHGRALGVDGGLLAHGCLVPRIVYLDAKALRAYAATAAYHYTCASTYLSRQTGMGAYRHMLNGMHDTQCGKAGHAVQHPRLAEGVHMRRWVMRQEETEVADSQHERARSGGRLMHEAVMQEQGTLGESSRGAAAAARRHSGKWHPGRRLHAGEREPPDLGGVLADARAEDDGVHVPQLHEVRAQVAPQPVHIHLARHARNKNLPHLVLKCGWRMCTPVSLAQQLACDVKAAKLV